MNVHLLHHDRLPQIAEGIDIIAVFGSCLEAIAQLDEQAENEAAAARRAQVTAGLSNDDGSEQGSDGDYAEQSDTESLNADDF